MSRLAVIPWLLSLAGFAAAAEFPDLLRFTNGDQLHGAFLGIKEGPQAIWRHDDLAAPVDFKTAQLRHIILHGGRPLKPLASLSHLGLVNGDRIPGTITGITGDTIILDTPYAGVLRIPRKQVSMLAPNPLGGRVYYHGPFVEDEWKMAHPSYPDGLPPSTAEGDKKKAEDADKKDPGKKDADKKIVDKNDPDKNDDPAEKKDVDQPGRWVFSGSAWYWQNKRAGTALIRETGMPDRAILRFDLAWKNRLSVAFGFHADFARPKPAEGEENKGGGGKGRPFVPGDSGDLPRLFGNSFVLQLHSSYLMLYRTSVDAEGKGSVERIQLNNNNNLRLAEMSQAKVEVRSNRHTGGITLFINDEFVAQWSENGVAGHDGGDFAGKGSGFGFLVQGDDTPVRISDIVVSEWNGMPDSARSLQVDDQDVILMANGTDRFAGQVGRLDEHGKVLFEGRHGQFQFPLDEVAEIRFARDRLAPVADEPAENFVVRLSPVGSISGRPVSGDGSMIGIVNPIAGELNLSLESAVMLDFNSSKQIIDDWDADF